METIKLTRGYDAEDEVEFHDVSDAFVHVLSMLLRAFTYISNVEYKNL
jgi:hypothetical protein